MGTLLFWAAVIFLQNASLTWVSRARASGSIGYHALAQVVCNACWFVSQALLVNSFIGFARGATTRAEFIGLMVFYVTFTSLGSVAMHWASMRWLEKGNRRVGVAT